MGNVKKMKTMFGTKCFWNQMCLEPNVFGTKCFWNQMFLEPNVFGTKCFWNQMFLEPNLWKNMKKVKAMFGSKYGSNKYYGNMCYICHICLLDPKFWIHIFFERQTSISKG